MTDWMDGEPLPYADMTETHWNILRELADGTLEWGAAVGAAWPDLHRAGLVNRNFGRITEAGMAALRDREKAQARKDDPPPLPYAEWTGDRLDALWEDYTEAAVGSFDNETQLDLHDIEGMNEAAHAIFVYACGQSAAITALRARAEAAEARIAALEAQLAAARADAIRVAIAETAKRKSVYKRNSEKFDHDDDDTLNEYEKYIFATEVCDWLSDKLTALLPTPANAGVTVAQADDRGGE
jgi:hypothetical protein